MLEEVNTRTDSDKEKNEKTNKGGGVSVELACMKMNMKHAQCLHVARFAANADIIAVVGNNL